MADSHLTPELFWAVRRRERSPLTLPRRVLVHLCRLCPPCREEVRAVSRLLRAVREGSGAAYRQSVRRAFESLQGEDGPWAEQARAREALAELLALPPARRRAAVEADGERFRGPALAELLLAECRGQLPGDPTAAGELADLAQAVLEQSPAGLVAAEVYARAAAYRGNARRVAGWLNEAEVDFAFARFLLAARGAGDALTGAELDFLEGSLLRDQRRLEEAGELLERSVAAYARHGTDLDRARALIGLAVLWRERRQPARAVPPTEEALAPIDPERQPDLAVAARHNLAQFHCDLGHFEEARRRLEECAPLYRHFPGPAIQLRRRWLEAGIARGLGETEAAEAAYREVRAGFQQEGVAYDVALVSLDLAVLYLEQGRTGAVKALAEEMVPLFEAQGVHREAAAALLLFVQAARAERLTLAWLRHLGRYLEAARQNPDLAFHERP